LGDVDFSEKTGTSICCSECGECYYIEASKEGSLDGLKRCVFCASYSVTSLEENLHEHYTRRNGDFVEISCQGCDRKSNLGIPKSVSTDVIYCPFCGGEAERSS